jgi:hypothetical protein
VHGAATEDEIVSTHVVRVRGQIVHLDDPADAAKRALRDDDATDDLARPGRAGSVAAVAFTPAGLIVSASSAK